MIPQYYFNESVNVKIKEIAMPRMPRTPRMVPRTPRCLAASHVNKTLNLLLVKKWIFFSVVVFSQKRTRNKDE